MKIENVVNAQIPRNYENCHNKGNFIKLKTLNKFGPLRLIMFTLAEDINTPGKLSQVPPAEVLIIGCDRRPELPVMVRI